MKNKRKDKELQNWTKGKVGDIISGDTGFKAETIKQKENRYIIYANKWERVLWIYSCNS